MKERPILFSTPMIKAILKGQKTMTRRVVKNAVYMTCDGKDITPKDLDVSGWVKLCPYGEVGDRLWCRETHYRFGHWIKNGLTKKGKQKWLFKARNNEVRYMDNLPTENVHRLKEKDAIGWFKRSSLFLPRWASRITLEITNIKVERVWDITGKEVISEGVQYPVTPEGHPLLNISSKYSPANYLRPGLFKDINLTEDEWLQAHFASLWDSINAERGYPWEFNPFVWCIEFKKVQP